MAVVSPPKWPWKTFTAKRLSTKRMVDSYHPNGRDIRRATCYLINFLTGGAL